MDVSERLTRLMLSQTHTMVLPCQLVCAPLAFSGMEAEPASIKRRTVPMSQRLRFGIFLAPFHKPGINPTLALQSDLELIQWLDRCGYDEAWLGEHHSAGTELSASPEIMIATAAERTRNIKLGTGVVSVSYHNPLWVAERIVKSRWASDGVLTAPDSRSTELSNDPRARYGDLCTFLLPALKDGRRRKM